MAKLKEVERAMVEYFAQHQDKAGLGLYILPGVRELLERLQVRCACLFGSNNLVQQQQATQGAVD